MKIVRCETPQKEELAFESGSVKVDEKSGDVTFEAIAVDTKKTPNRKGFTFKWATPADVDVSSLQANGRLYFMHDTFEIGIGFIVGIKVTKSQVRMKGLIPGDSRFSEEMQDSELVQRIREVREAVVTGLVKAVSIGFYIKQYEEMTDPKDGRVIGLRVTQFEIIELSVVTIGAHETALILSAPGVTCEDADVEWAEEQFDTEHQGADFDAHGERRIHRQGELITLGVETEAPEKAPANVDDFEEFLAMAQAQNQAVNDQEEEVLEDNDAQVNEFVQHHDTETGEVTERSAKRAMARLLGARGGIVGASAGDRESAWMHMKRHFDELDIAIPAFKEKFSKEELAELHSKGLIEIPGHKQAEMTVKLDSGAFNDQLEKLEDICVRIEQAVQKAERVGLVAIDDAVPAEMPEPQPAVAFDEDALRQQVRNALSDPKLRELSKLQAKAFVEMKAEENKRRIQNVRRK